VAALMAELEMAQGDEGRAREWMARALNARRDPAWTADAFVSDHWLPISPVSGRLDALEWKDPLAGEDHGPIIEHRAEPQVPATVPTVQAGPTAAPAATRSASGEGAPQAEPQDAPRPLPVNEEREPARQADDGEPRPRQLDEEESRRSPFFGGGRRDRRPRAAAMADESRPARADMTPVAPAVIPLVHAPDDPGTNGEKPEEPETEAPPPSDGWSRIRALFRS
jgi:HemY protein